MLSEIELFSGSGQPDAVSRPVIRVQRDRFVDAWRGIFHVVMLIDHVPIVVPGVFAAVATWFEPIGYFSVAEGFVFLSGFVSGLVYTRVRRESGQRAVWTKALRRAGEIYFCYVVAVVGMLAVGKFGGQRLFESGFWPNLASLPLPMASIKIATLVSQPMFLEILPMYALFMLVTPVIVNQLESNRGIVLAAVSLFLWLAAQFGIRDALTNILQSRIDVSFGVFNTFAWQVLFVSGCACGHRSYVGEGRWLSRGRMLPVIAYLIMGVFFALRHELIDWHLEERWVSRSTMGPLRLLNVACIIFLVCKGRFLLERWIAWKGFAFLSRYSLQVFAFHLYPFFLVVTVIGTRKSLEWWSQSLLIGFCIASLFAIAILARFWRIGVTQLGSKGLARPG